MTSDNCLLSFSDVKPLDEKAPTLFDQVKTHLYDTGKSAWNNYISPNLLKGLQDNENKKLKKYHRERISIMSMYLG